MKKSEAIQLYRLVNQWTRAEIMARLGRFDNLEFADYTQIQLEKKDEIRELVFGTSDLIVLAERWGLAKDKPRRERKKKKKRKQ